jgi:hypothetical protein
MYVVLNSRNNLPQQECYVRHSLSEKVRKNKFSQMKRRDKILILFMPLDLIYNL